jgi:hypothetical protein
MVIQMGSNGDDDPTIVHRETEKKAHKNTSRGTAQKYSTSAFAAADERSDEDKSRDKLSYAGSHVDHQSQDIQGIFFQINNSSR